MNKAFVSRGLLGFVALLVVSVLLVLAIFRPSAAQGGGNSPDAGIVSDPVEVPNDPGQKIQACVYMYGRGHGTRPVETTFDVQVDLFGPTGPDTVRRTIVFPHPLDVRGNMARVSLVQSGDNFDLYFNGQLVQPQCLNGLPPGEPYIGCRINSNTTWNNLGNAAIIGGTIQVIDSGGKTVALGKSHELTGNVTLIK